MARVDDVRAALIGVIDPEIRRPITELGMVERVDVDGAHASVRLRLTVVGCPAADRIAGDTERAVLAVDGIATAEVTLGVMSPEERSALVKGLRGGRTVQVPSTARVIAVASGKGGVGKSSVTVNLALALAARGHRVGVLDADVHGFSVPGLLGAVGMTPTRVGELLMPPEAHGMPFASIGMLVDPGQAVVWRGPLLQRTVQQFLTDVHWGDIDTLVIDMPPGTGDVAITLGHVLPEAHVVVITTPQAAAVDIAERAAHVATQTGQRVIGVIETMSPMTLPDGSTLDLFGSGGGARAAERLGVPLLGTVPLSPAWRVAGDEGVPVVLGSPDDAAALAVRSIAARIDGSDATAPTGLA